MDPKSEIEMKEGPGGKGRWVTPEELTHLMPLGLSYVRHLYSRTIEKWRCASRFDERDVWRFSKSKILIWFMERNPRTGEHYPRTVERPDDPPEFRRVRVAKRPGHDEEELESECDSD